MSAQILYIIFANKKLVGKTHLSSHISVSEVGKYILRLENKKLCGLDGVGNQLLKLSLPYIIDSLAYVFNLCTEKNIFPSELKKAKMVQTNPTNYRPVSLLSVLSKLLKKHVHLEMIT